MRQCSICKKSSISGGTRKLLRGHYNPTSRGRKKANLQWVRIQKNNKAERILVCMKCLKQLPKRAVV